MSDNFQIASVTGVDMQLNVAGPGARSYAFVIDWHIRVLLALAWMLVGSLIFTGGAAFLALDESEVPDFSLYAMVVLYPAGVIYALYHLILELVMRGRTPGKRIAGVRIVTEQGQQPSVMAIVLRNVLRLLDSLPLGYMLGLTTTIITQRSQRIGDMAAGTLLIYDVDEAATAKNTAHMNPELVASYGLERVELAADLLQRWPQLRSVERATLARQVLRQLGVDGVDAMTEQHLHQHLRSRLQ